jgi:hypothetical protein
MKIKDLKVFQTITSSACWYFFTTIAVAVMNDNPKRIIF